MSGLRSGCLWLLAGCLIALSNAATQAQEKAPTTPGVHVLTDGPIHEAFAQPGQSSPPPSIIVPREPPPPVEEQPPDQKPEGDNVQWIAGYWAWDVQRNDFIWASGFWRVPPPGRHWVPGSWTKVSDGWQRTPGYWADNRQQEMTMQEPPPASLDYGPVVPAPGDNSIYVPGCWIPRNDSYCWRPGFWQTARPGWIWSDACYQSTPAGDRFVDGYWDRCLEDRGLLTSDVSFDPSVYATPGFVYQPSAALDPSYLLSSLLVQPGGAYYLGDYNNPAYARLGFQPWYAHRGRVGDSLFRYYRWAHRDDRSWFARTQRPWSGASSAHGLNSDHHSAGWNGFDARSARADRALSISRSNLSAPGRDFVHQGRPTWQEDRSALPMSSLPTTTRPGYRQEIASGHAALQTPGSQRLAHDNRSSQYGSLSVPPARFASSALSMPRANPAAKPSFAATARYAPATTHVSSRPPDLHAGHASAHAPSSTHRSSSHSTSTAKAGHHH